MALHHNPGDSFSVWGWFKIVGTGPGGLFGPYTSYYVTVFYQLMIEVGNTNNPGNVHIMSRNNDDYFNVSIGAWHFFHLFHDATLNKSGYSIDNAAETLMANNETWPNGNGSVLLTSGPGALLANCDVIFDEIGIKMGAKLSSTQVSYLYNSGSGRTWPIP